VADWKRIKAEYLAGGTSYRKLAEKHGVSFNTLKTRATVEQWYELRQQKDHKTTTKTVEKLSDEESDQAVDLISVADKLLDKIGKIAEMYDDPDSIKKLTSAIKDLKDIKGYKSEADMREQEARIEKLRKECEKDNGNDLPTLKIEGLPEEFKK
jgi:transposase-like protein